MSIEKITTAVIPAGGWGTRFMPATKSIPKEMFPLGSKPIILHVVEELVASGITNIIFVVSHHKQSIESFFAPNEILENYISKISDKNKGDELKSIPNLATFDFVYTHEPMGNGGALSSVRHLVKDKPFVLIWSDEIILSKTKPRVAQCLDAYYKYGKPVISAIKIEDPFKRSKYGMAELNDLKGETEIKEIKNIIEKPAFGKAPSMYATHGAYVLTPAIFDALDKTKAGANGEIWLTDIINIMRKETGLLAKIISDGHYLDCGDPMQYLLSQVDYFINYSEFADEALMALAQPVCHR
ncbi:MAG: UTP--glucose-1-phosphate uridylyltransferase [Patescibacteria group bacterium]